MAAASLIRPSSGLIPSLSATSSGSSVSDMEVKPEMSAKTIVATLRSDSAVSGSCMASPVPSVMAGPAASLSSS
jgi:hypothetical protein